MIAAMHGLTHIDLVHSRMAITPEIGIYKSINAIIYRRGAEKISVFAGADLAANIHIIRAHPSVEMTVNFYITITNLCVSAPLR